MRIWTRKQDARGVKFEQFPITKYLEKNKEEWKKNDSWLNTRMRSLSMIVRKRWATVRTVHSTNFSRMVFWMSSSVLNDQIMMMMKKKIFLVNVQTDALSTLAVPSSMTRIRLFFRIILAKQTNCFCPTLKFCPLSLTIDWSPLDIFSSTNLFNWTSKKEKRQILTKIC